jgi:hypothetical protein
MEIEKMEEELLPEQCFFMDAQQLLDDHAAKFRIFQEETSAQLKNMKQLLRKNVSTRCRTTMTPKESFEYRLQSELAVSADIPWYLLGKDGDIETDRGYLYVIGTNAPFQFEDDFMEFVQDDNRYTVDWDSHSPKMSSPTFGTLDVYFIPKGMFDDDDESDDDESDDDEDEADSDN